MCVMLKFYLSLRRDSRKNRIGSYNVCFSEFQDLKSLEIERWIYFRKAPYLHGWSETNAYIKFCETSYRHQGYVETTLNVFFPKFPKVPNKNIGIQKKTMMRFLRVRKKLCDRNNIKDRELRVCRILRSVSYNRQLQIFIIRQIYIIYIISSWPKSVILSFPHAHVKYMHFVRQTFWPAFPAFIRMRLRGENF